MEGAAGVLRSTGKLLGFSGLTGVLLMCAGLAAVLVGYADTSGLFEPKGTAAAWLSSAPVGEMLLGLAGFLSCRRCLEQLSYHGSAAVVCRSGGSTAVWCHLATTRVLVKDRAQIPMCCYCQGGFGSQGTTAGGVTTSALWLLWMGWHLHSVGQWPDGARYTGLWGSGP